MAAPVLQRMRELIPRLEAFGVGGPALAALGFDSLVEMHLLAGMGIDAARKLLSLVACYRRLRLEVRMRRPRAALLVGFSDFNARLGAWLRREGVRVLWYAPPQIWAWRSDRGERLKHSADRLALTLPFEAEQWTRLGADAQYVGHPALERVTPRASAAQPRLVPESSQVGSEHSRALALLPGSRQAEVRTHWPLLRAAVRSLQLQRPRWRYTLMISPALPPATQRALAASAAEHQVSVARGDASQLLAEHDLALVCSGTATLECAIAGCPPVIFFHMNKYAARLLQRMLNVPHVGLPNLLLERRAFPELVGEAATANNLSAAAVALAEQLGQAAGDCADVITRLNAALDRGAGSRNAGPSQRVADLLHPWLT